MFIGKEFRKKLILHRRSPFLNAVKQQKSQNATIIKHLEQVRYFSILIPRQQLQQN